MKSLWVGILTGAVLLQMICSCATAPTAPPAPGEVRLLGVTLSDSGNIKQKAQCTVNIEFEAATPPEITRVAVVWGGIGTNYTNKVDMHYQNRLLRADVPTPEVPGSYGLKAYVYYVREGKIEQSNAVETSVQVRDATKKQKMR